MNTREPLGFRCSTHGWQDGRTICRFCSARQLPKSSRSVAAPSDATLAGTLSLSDPSFLFKLPKNVFEEMLKQMP